MQLKVALPVEARASHLRLHLTQRTDDPMHAPKV